MALKYLQVDDVTSKEKRVASLYKEDFFTGNASAVDFTLTNGTVTASNLIDVYENGVLLEETSDYSRNAGSNKITRNTAPPNNARVRVRVWS